MDEPPQLHVVDRVPADPEYQETVENIRRLEAGERMHDAPRPRPTREAASGGSVWFWIVLVMAIAAAAAFVGLVKRERPPVVAAPAASAIPAGPPIAVMTKRISDTERVHLIHVRPSTGSSMADRYCLVFSAQQTSMQCWESLLAPPDVADWPELSAPER